MIDHRMNLEKARELWPMEGDEKFPDDLLYRTHRAQHDEALEQAETAGARRMWATLSWCASEGKSYEETLSTLLGQFSREANDFGGFHEMRAAYLRGMGSAVYPIQCELWNLRDTGTGWWA